MHHALNNDVDNVAGQTQSGLIMMRLFVTEVKPY